MKTGDVRVLQYVSFNDAGAYAEFFQIEFGDTVIEDLKREDLQKIMKSIDNALLFGVNVPIEQQRLQMSKNEED